MNFNKYWISAVSGRQLSCAQLLGQCRGGDSRFEFGEMETGKVYSFQKGDEVMAAYFRIGGSVKLFYRQEITAYKDAAHTEGLNYNSTFSYGLTETDQGVDSSQARCCISTHLQPPPLIQARFWSRGQPETVNLVSTSRSLNPRDNNYMGDQILCLNPLRMSFFFDETVVAQARALRFPRRILRVHS